MVLHTHQPANKPCKMIILQRDQVKKVARDLSEDFALKPTQAAAKAELERDRTAAAALQVTLPEPDNSLKPDFLASSDLGTTRHVAILQCDPSQSQMFNRVTVSRGHVKRSGGAAGWQWTARR